MAVTTNNLIKHIKDKDKEYSIFSITRYELFFALGYNKDALEKVNKLSDDDMKKIAELITANTSVYELDDNILMAYYTLFKK